MLAKLVRLGRDAEVRYTPKGDPVASLAMVYDVGFGDSKRGQWIDGTLWGKRAESLGPYLTKGTQVVLYADDVELEQFMKKDGTPGAKLKCRVSDLSLISGQSQQQSPQQRQPQQQRQQQQQQAQQQAPQQQQGQGEEFEDIPF
jgi:single-strand DNA-binding protein